MFILQIAAVKKICFPIVHHLANFVKMIMIKANLNSNMIQKQVCGRAQLYL